MNERKEERELNEPDFYLKKVPSCLLLVAAAGWLAHGSLLVSNL